MSGLCDWRSDAFTFQENEAFCNEVTELALAERPLRMFFQAGQLLTDHTPAGTPGCTSVRSPTCGSWRHRATSAQGEETRPAHTAWIARLGPAVRHACE